MQLNIEKGLIGAAVLGALVLMAPMARQSKEFMNCVKNAETGIVNLTGVQFLDEDGKGGFIERLWPFTIATAVTSPSISTWWGSDGLDRSAHPCRLIR